MRTLKVRKRFVIWNLIIMASLLMTPFFNWSLPVAQAQPGVKTFNISAIDVDITINRFGDHDPLGKMYVLDENIAALRAQEVAPLPDRVSSGLRDDLIQPLVIRANIGDMVVINFTNRLAGGRASVTIHGLPSDPATSAGSDVGLTPDTTVAPGQTITYTWVIPDRRIWKVHSYLTAWVPISASSRHMACSVC